MLWLAVVVAVPEAAPAQATAPWGADTSVARFIDAARRGSERYRDRNAAIADGFRLIGGDFPDMGEHWVHAGRLMAGRLRTGQPTFLTYTPIRGTVTLVGVGYATVLRSHDQLPAFPAGAWHGHGGTVDEASFVELHDHATPGPRRTQIAVLHAWVWLANPNGVFETHNVALPFAKAGLDQPASATATTARALSLGYGSELFYRAAIAHTGATESVLREIDSLITMTAGRVRYLVDSTRDQSLPREQLSDLWNQLWDQIGRRSPTATSARTLGFDRKD